jgi:hypothetical protein
VKRQGAKRKGMHWKGVMERTEMAQRQTRAREGWKEESREEKEGKKERKKGGSADAVGVMLCPCVLFCLHGFCVLYIPPP